MSSSTTNLVHPTVALLDQVSLDLHHIHPRLQKLLKSAKPRAGAQKAFDGMKEPLEHVAQLYTAGQQNQDWHSATIFRFYSSVTLLAHLTKISGHSWTLPSVEAERLSKDPKRDVINFKSDDCSQLAIEPELVEKVRKMEQQSKHTQPTAADDLGLSLSEADDGDDLLQDLGFEASPPEHSPSPEPTTVPDESAESEVEVEPSVKRQKGKGKAKAELTTLEAPVIPTLSKKKRSVGRKTNSEFKSKSVVDTDDASDDEFAPELAHKTIVLKPEARKAEPVGSCPGPAPPPDPLRLEYGTAGPLTLADIQSMQTNMNRELPHVTCVRCVLTKHDQDCEPSDPNSVPEGIAQSKCVRCNKQNQHCSFSDETDASNDELLKLLAAISSHPKVVKMLGIEASLHMVADSQRMARLARDAFSDKLTQFVRSGHNPKSVLSALDNGDSKFTPADEKLLADFFNWPILPSSGTSGEKAASEDGEDNDDDNDADGSLDEEAKAPPPASKTTKAPMKVPDSKAKDPKAPTTSTSGTRTRSGQRGGKPVSTSGANLPRGRKRAIEEEVKAGPSSKRTKVATKEK
ncbi:hypothetical protein L218DRAFT_963073 [Marasmius fiardii PR-910]|nr:hypothetical protein L218DRAFT_963073 [Marasmius fiardii PR-910]